MRILPLAIVLLASCFARRLRHSLEAAGDQL